MGCLSLPRAYVTIYKTQNCYWGAGEDDKSSLCSIEDGGKLLLVSISRFQQQSEKLLGELTNCLALIRVFKGNMGSSQVFALFRVSKGDEIIQHKKNSAACITWEFSC